MPPERGTPDWDLWRKRLSVSASKRVITQDTREILRRVRSGAGNPNYGKKHSEETRKKISESVKRNRKPNSPETTALLSRRQKESWEIGGAHRQSAAERARNRIHTEEELQKLSESKIGKKRSPRSEEHCRKISESAKARCSDPEYRKRMSERAKKQWRDPQYRATMIERAKKQWCDPQYRATMIERSRIQWADPAAHTHASVKATERWASKEERNAQSERIKQTHNTPEVRAKMSAAQQKRVGNPEERNRRSASAKERLGTPEARIKNSERTKMYYALHPAARDRLRETTTKHYIDSQWYGSVSYGERPVYCEKWTPELRDRVRAFWGYACAECGAKQNGRKLAVHHVWYNKKTCCDDSPRVLVPLCETCHGKTTHNRPYWSEHFQTMVDELYDGRCWFTREEYAEHKKSLSPPTPTITYGSKSKQVDSESQAQTGRAFSPTRVSCEG